MRFESCSLVMIQRLKRQRAYLSLRCKCWLLTVSCGRVVNSSVGIQTFDCVQEGNFYKYCIGSSTNYNDISRLRGKLLKDFPQAFIIAYKNDARMDVIKQ